MHRLPLSIQTFEKIRQANQIYVDKTDLIWKLASEAQYVFLSRPRRFGKSLLISTLDSYFRGARELFEGLKIEQLESDWRPYPVLRVDFSNVNYRKKDELERSLQGMLRQIALEHEIPWVEDESEPVNLAFTNLIHEIYAKSGPIVILIDEYDKPLVNVLDDMALFRRNQAVLAPFYGALKGNDQKIRFAMLTGVSQFAKLNIFSGLNNLRDISLLPAYATLTGFSNAELDEYFPDYLQAFQESTGLSEALFRESFKLMYNGYSWNGTDFLYNPFSVLNALDTQFFRDFWYHTGGSVTFLTDLIRHHEIRPEDLAPHRTTQLIGHSVDPAQIPLPALLFQTGYLTIKEKRVTFGRESYVLDYPNEEVRRAFFQSILQSFAPKPIEQYGDLAYDVKASLHEGDPDTLFATLRRLFASIPARLHLPYEAYYHSMVYLFLRMVGFRVQLERETSAGRIDGVIELNERTFIVEFKFAKQGKPETLSQRAVDQIRERSYFEAYRTSAHELILLGVGVVKKELHGRWEVV